MAGEEVIADLIIRLRVQDGAVSTALKGTQKDLESTAAAGMTFSQKIGAVSSGLASVGYAGYAVMHMFDRYEISQMAVENAVNRVQNAQMAYNAAIAKYGTEGRQAIAAANVLETSQNRLNSANIRATASMALIGVSALSLVPQFLTAGKALVTFATTGRIAIWGLTLTMSSLLPWIVGLGVALGLLYYWYSKNQAKAYELNSEQRSLADSTDSLSLSMADAFRMLDPMDRAYAGILGLLVRHNQLLDEKNRLIEEGKIGTAEYILKQLELKENEKELAEKVLNSGMSYREANEFLKQFGLTVEDLGLKEDDFKRRVEEATAAINAQKDIFPGWKDALCNAIDAVIKNVNDCIQTWTDFGSKIGGILGKSILDFALWIQNTIDTAVSKGAEITSAIVAPFQTAYNYIKRLYDAATSWIWQPGGGVGGGFGGGGGGAGGEGQPYGYGESDVGEAIEKGWGYESGGGVVYYGFQHGGIVKKPTRAIIGEAGAEAIVPLPSGGIKGLGRGGDINLEINFNAPIYGVDDLDRAIENAIKELKWNIKALGA